MPTRILLVEDHPAEVPRTLDELIDDADRSMHQGERNKKKLAPG